MADKLKQVEEFWNNNLCGEHFINARYPSKEFFQQYREFRYRKEHHLNHLIDWHSAQNRDVLEIGSGVGADGTHWASHARSYTAIDLTSEAVAATSTHLRLLGLKGNIIKSDAEVLPFHDHEFDIVYSHGVLHHTPSIEDALREVFRVLKPNGEFIVMLYSKDSFNYWFRIQFYFRIRFLAGLFKDKLGLKIADPWKRHVKNYRNIGLSYFSWGNWPHHCTDGPDCEIANIYDKREIVHLLDKAGFIIKKMRKTHFPIAGKYPTIELFLAKYFGFYQFIWATKE